jgi:hypothetical protein
MASFDLILPHARQGKRFRRKGWIRWVFLDSRHGFAQVSDTFGVMPRHLGAEDILANDWELEEKSNA